MRPPRLTFYSTLVLGPILAAAPLHAQGLDLSLEHEYSLSILGPGGSAFDQVTGSLWVSDGAGTGSAVPPGTNNVLEIDPFTGAIRSWFLASVVPGLADGPDAVALDEASGDLFLFGAYGDNAAGRVTQSGVLVQSYPSSHNVAAAAFHPDGSLWVVPALVFPPVLWKFDLTTGQLTNPVPLSGVSDSALAADFDPVTGNLFLSTYPGRALLEVDLAAGQVVSSTSLQPWIASSSSVTALSFDAAGTHVFIGSAATHAPNRTYVLKRGLAATWSVYGQGFPGTLGVPAIGASGPPVVGSTVSVQIGNSAGVATTGLVIAGDAMTLAPGAWGGSLLVVPNVAAVLPVPPAGLTLAWAIPPDPALWNVTIFAQALLADAGALAGISNTAGLRLFLGV